MFDHLLIHPKTIKNLRSFISAPSHALLLVGPSGSGKLSLAKRTAAELLGLGFDKLKNYPHFIVIERPMDKQEITIDQIRQVNKLLALQIPGKSAIRRVVIIKNAHYLGGEAQNAFLKSLEEPSADTVFILTANSKQSLLPTVVSRTTPMDVYGVGLNHALEWFANIPKAEVVAAWNLSEGSPSALVGLVNNQNQTLVGYINQAKAFLSKSPYQKFAQLEALSKDKLALSDFLDAVGRVVRALYRSYAAKGQNSQTQKLVKAMKAITTAQNDLGLNVSPKLVISSLSLNLHL